VGMKIELTGAHNITELKILRVWFELQLPTKGNQTPKHKTVWEISPGDSLKNVGESITYKGSAVVDDDYGQFAVLGHAQLELTDAYGHSNKKAGGGYYEDNPGARQITLWTMSSGKTASIALMAGAFPVTITGSILVAAGAVMGFFGSRRERLSRWSWKVCIAGCILSILAVPFYVMGVNALVDLTGYTSWLSWRPAFGLAIAGACLSAMPAALYILVRPAAAPRPTGTRAGPGKMAAPAAKKEGKDPQLPPTNLKSGKP